jgi:hypothetical protein
LYRVVAYLSIPPTNVNIAAFNIRCDQVTSKLVVHKKHLFASSEHQFAIGYLRSLGL